MLERRAADRATRRAPRRSSAATRPAAGPRARTSPTWSTRAASSSTARFAIAAQRAGARSDELLERTPADGLIAGTARINGELFGDERGACAVLSYDYTVLAGTQGAIGPPEEGPPVRADRADAAADRASSPRAAEGGPATPTTPSSRRSRRARSPSGPGSRAWCRGSRSSPGAASPATPCIAGASDLIVATESIVARDGRPGDDRGRRARDRRARRRSALSDVQGRNGVVDVAVADEAEAVAVGEAPALLLPGPAADWASRRPTRRALREVVPERRRRAYDVHERGRRPRRRRLGRPSCASASRRGW